MDKNLRKIEDLDQDHVPELPPLPTVTIGSLQAQYDALKQTGVVLDAAKAHEFEETLDGLRQLHGEHIVLGEAQIVLGLAHLLKTMPTQMTPAIEGILGTTKKRKRLLFDEEE